MGINRTTELKNMKFIQPSSPPPSAFKNKPRKAKPLMISTEIICETIIHASSFLDERFGAGADEDESVVSGVNF